MFKHLSDESLHVLLTLLNGIWASSDLPPSWLHSIIVPIPKPKKPSHLPSYRPVFLKLFYSIAPFSLSTRRFRPQSQIKGAGSGAQLKI